MEWTDKVRKRLTVITMTDAGRIAGRSVLPTMQKRIFERGETPTGAQIGKYSTRPLYIDLADMSKTSVGQKTADGKAKFFPGGYAEYKRAIGAKGFNLRNFGVMMRDFLSPMEKVNGDRVTLSFKEERNKEISDRYPQAFGMSEPEKQIFNEVVISEIQKRISRD